MWHVGIPKKILGARNLGSLGLWKILLVVRGLKRILHTCKKSIPSKRSDENVPCQSQPEYLFALQLNWVGLSWGQCSEVLQLYRWYKPRCSQETAEGQHRKYMSEYISNRRNTVSLGRERVILRLLMCSHFFLIIHPGGVPPPVHSIKNYHTYGHKVSTPSIYIQMDCIKEIIEGENTLPYQSW